MPAPRRPRPASRAAVVRRRRLAVLALAALALVAGVAVGSGGGDDPPRPPRPAAAQPASAAGAVAAVDRLSLPQQVGQLIVLRFAGTSVPAYVRRALKRNRVAGAILFRDNATGPEQATALTGSLHDAAGDLAPIVCVDQEGGSIRILPWSPPQRSQLDQETAGTVAEDARAAAGALREQGVNVTLGPVADVPSISGSAMAGREFAADPEVAAAAIDAAVRAWRDGGVAPTLKHFPGLGGATVNTDDAPATVAHSRDQLASDLVPFRAGIAAGAPLVMVSSAYYPAYDGRRIASQSPPISTTLLRDELGFEGVAMTDSIEAAAVTAVTPDPGVAAVASVQAGIDVVLTTGRGSYIRAFRALVAAARDDAGLRARVRESAARVLALRSRL